jgi:hypothetical protein
MTTELLERESFESLCSRLIMEGLKRRQSVHTSSNKVHANPSSSFHQAAPMVALMTLGVLNAAPTLAMYRLEASSPRPNAMLAG